MLATLENHQNSVPLDDEVMFEIIVAMSSGYVSTKS